MGRSGDARKGGETGRHPDQPRPLPVWRRTALGVVCSRNNSGTGRNPRLDFEQEGATRRGVLERGCGGERRCVRTLRRPPGVAEQRLEALCTFNRHRPQGRTDVLSLVRILRPSGFAFASSGCSLARYARSFAREFQSLPLYLWAREGPNLADYPYLQVLCVGHFWDGHLHFRASSPVIQHDLQTPGHKEEGRRSGW